VQVKFCHPDAQIPDPRHSSRETKVPVKGRQNAAVAKASEGFFLLCKNSNGFRLEWYVLCFSRASGVDFDAVRFGGAARAAERGIGVAPRIYGGTRL
jgi:hypothetical protein